MEIIIMSKQTKKKSSRKPAAKMTQKRANFLPFLAAVAVVACVAVVFLVNRNENSNGSNNEDNAVSIADTVVSARTQTDNNRADDEADGTNTIASDERQDENNVTGRDVNEAVTIAPGESLVIPTANIFTDASFFPVEVDGTAMEVVAVRDSAGNIRTAFNTCQVCYDSGRGYYVQSGDYLICQNCGNRFAMDQVEIESGGCNPWPIFDENKTETEDEISISYDFLVEAQGIFANWKGDY